MNTLYAVILAVVGLLFAIYIYYYYSYPPEMSILQTTLDEFSLDLLREKQPLVIQDRVSDIQQLRKLWFPYSITTQSQVQANIGWQRTTFKHLMLQAQAEPVTIYIAPQKAKMITNEEGLPEPDPETTVLAGIQLASLQILILPRRSYYAIQTEEKKNPAPLYALGVHDYVSYFLPA